MEATPRALCGVKMDRKDREGPSCHFVPPKGEEGVRLAQVENLLREALRPFITGRGKEKRLEEAIEGSIKALRPMLKLPKQPDLGATVMTEAAAARNKAGNFTKGPKNL